MRINPMGRSLLKDTRVSAKDVGSLLDGFLVLMQVADKLAIVLGARKYIIKFSTPLPVSIDQIVVY
jgi:hypothetical protein